MLVLEWCLCLSSRYAGHRRVCSWHSQLWCAWSWIPVQEHPGIIIMLGNEKDAREWELLRDPSAARGNSATWERSWTRTGFAQGDHDICIRSNFDILVGLVNTKVLDTIMVLVIINFLDSRHHHGHGHHGQVSCIVGPITWISLLSESKIH